MWGSARGLGGLWEGWGRGHAHSRGCGGAKRFGGWTGKGELRPRPPRESLLFRSNHTEPSLGTRAPSPSPGRWERGVSASDRVHMLGPHACLVGRPRAAPCPAEPRSVGTCNASSCHRASRGQPGSARPSLCPARASLSRSLREPLEAGRRRAAEGSARWGSGAHTAAGRQPGFPGLSAA